MKLTGDVDVPGLGKVDKRVLIGVGGVAAVFVGWKWWQARNAAAYDAGEEAVDPGFEDGGLLPGVAGAVRPGNDYGIPGEGPSQDDFGFTGKTNAQWTQYAANQLMQGSDTWSYATVVAALGKFLANRPLDPEEVRIVQAAIAVAGYPPEGSHVIIPGGNTPVLVAPTGLKGTATSDTAVSLSWNAVAGADEYKVYRGSAVAATVSGTSASVTGLTASTSYGFQVAALSAGGEAGPKSATVTVKTKDKPKTTDPKPADPKPSTPKPTGKKYPTKWKTVINGRGSNYSSIAKKYKLGISGTELYNYQFTSQAGRPASTKATLRKRGPNLIYAAGTTVLPYPK